MIRTVLDFPILGGVVEWTLIALYVAGFLWLAVRHGLAVSLSNAYFSTSDRLGGALAGLSMTLGSVVWFGSWFGLYFGTCYDRKERLSTVRLENWLYVSLRLPLFVFLAQYSAPFVALAFGLESIGLLLFGIWKLFSWLVAILRLRCANEWKQLSTSAADCGKV